MEFPKDFSPAALKELVATVLAALSEGNPRALLDALTKGEHKYTPPPRLLPPPSRSGNTKSFDGTSIYWELHGPEAAEGLPRPLVFCYGLVCHMNQWRAQIERFSPKRPCLLVDYRGHHASAFPEDPRLMNISALSKDVVAAMDAVGFKTPAHIWGHSLGFDVALELAAAEAWRCASLTLCCGTVESPFRNMFGTNILEKWVGALIAHYPERTDVFHLAWRLLSARPDFTQLLAKTLGFNMQASTIKDVDAYVVSVLGVDPRTFFSLIKELNKGMTKAIVPKIQVPTLIVAGGHDYITPSGPMKEVARSLKNAYFVEIPGGSHNVQLDFGEYVGLKAEELWREWGLE